MTYRAPAPMVSLAAAVSLSILAQSACAAGDVRITSGQSERPQLVFACELATGPLESLLARPDVISDLKSLNAGVSLALVDLSPGRARAVRELNQAGIPVTAWLVLPKDQGYFLNAGNAPQAAERFAGFEKWTADQGLRWAGVGLDIEPNIRELAALTQGSAWRLAGILIRRSFDSERVRRAAEAYSQLIRQIHAGGYRIETYQFPFMADERKAHSTLLDRLFGVLNVRGDHEVLMLYTSFNHSLGAGVIWKYGPDAQAIAVGSTGGNSELDANFAPLNWDEFSRDLLVARHFTPNIGVYSLEGCVRQDFLPRLKTMHWDQPVTLPASSVRKAALLRTGIIVALWTGSHLPYLAAGILAAAWLMWRRRARKKLHHP